MENRTSERLKRNIEKIMKKWEERTYKEVVAALHLDSFALRDSLPEYLAQLVDALSTAIDRTDARIKAVASHIIGDTVVSDKR